MNIFTKKGLVFMVQVDHLSGENLGQVIQYLYDAGASNVQVIPTITKKNRPAHIVFIDCRNEYSDMIEKVIARELTSGGWHRINTEHRHLCTEILKKQVSVVSEAGQFLFDIEGKKIGDGCSNIRPEHQNCLDLKDEIFKKFEKNISLNDAYYWISEVLHNMDKNEIRIMGAE